MTEPEIIEALAEIGLKAKVSPTNDLEWRRVFAIDSDDVTQGRFSVRNNELHYTKWYVNKFNEGQILDDERIPWAWTLWTQRQERLDVGSWNAVVNEATAIAVHAREELHAKRDENPNPKRKRLKLNVRKYVRQILMGVQ